MVAPHPSLPPLLPAPCSRCRPEFDAIPTGLKKSSSSSRKKASTSSDTSEASSAPEETRFLGCYGSESLFLDKIYNGGSTGANYNLALHHAKSSKKRYFAVARGGQDGHAFAFSAFDSKASGAGVMNGGGEE
jgi:hypothetical protein